MRTRGEDAMRRARLRPFLARAGPALFALAYLVLARAGYLLLDREGGVSVLWPPAGLFVAVLLVEPPRRWAAYVLAGLAAGVAGSVAFGRPVAVALGYYAGNAAEALLSALAVRALAGGRPRVTTPRGALLLVLVPAAVMAAVALGTRAVAAAITGGPFGLRPWIFWAGSALGVVVVAPALLAWAEPDEGPPVAGAARRAELALLVAAHGIAALALVQDGFYANEAVLLPPMLWAAVRFGVRGATASGAAMAVAVIAVAARGRGHIVEQASSPDEAALAVQFFLAILLATVLLAGAAVADRRRSEKALRLSRYATDRAADAIAMVEDDGTIAYANEALGRLAGAPASALAGTSIFRVLPGVEAGWAAFREEIRRGGSAAREEWPRAGGGEPVPHEVVASLLEFDGLAYLFLALRDVSDRRRAEEAARLAGVGTLAAGVAHEINNPLAYVVGNVEFARTELRRLRPRLAPAAAAELEEAGVALADAAEGAARVRDIVRDLKVFSRAEEGVGPVDAAQAMTAALAFARNELRHRARLTTAIAPVPAVIGNARRLGQVFLNLLVNAAQAIPEGQAEANEIAVSVRPAGGRVVAEVRDTGAGIAPEVRSRIFEPFFTTKPAGTGTGLGLSICHGIVSAMGGTIEVESAPGEGSTFRVLLPAASAPAPPAPGPAPTPASPLPPSRSTASARARVLVVDDDEGVLAVVRRVLSREHDVELSARGREALLRLDRGERFDALVCDLMMPEMSGMELLDEVARRDPALARRTLVLTGGAFTDAARAFLERSPVARLEKPFEAGALRRAVADLLASP